MPAIVPKVDEPKIGLFPPAINYKNLHQPTTKHGQNGNVEESESTMSSPIIQPLLARTEAEFK
jgi:hypothetical protein